MIAGSLELCRRRDQQLRFPHHAHRQDRVEQRRRFIRHAPGTIAPSFEVLLEVVEHDGHVPLAPERHHPLHATSDSLVRAREQSFGSLVPAARRDRPPKGFVHGELVDHAVKDHHPKLRHNLLGALDRAPHRARFAHALHPEHARAPHLAHPVRPRVLPAQEHAEQPLHQAPPPHEARLEHAHVAAEVVIDLVAIARIVERRRAVVDAEATRRAAHQVQRRPRMRRRGRSLFARAHLLAGEFRGLDRRLACAELLVHHGCGESGLLVAHRARPAKHVRHACGDELRREARDRAADLGAVARREHDQLGHGPGARQYLEELRGRHQAPRAEGVFHDEAGAFGRHEAMAGQMHDVEALDEQRGAEIVERPFFDDAEASAALLDQRRERGEQRLFFVLEIKLGWRVVR